MAEKKTFAREDSVLSHPRLFFLAIVLSLIFMDPFHWSPVASRDYQPVKLDVAPYKQVMKSWRNDNQSRLRNARLQFAGEVFGPESIEFDREGRGPYTGLADGRVVRWMGETVGWETFAIVSTNWSEKECANGVNSTTQKQHPKERFCGRPLGLRFDKRTGDLYIADAYYGLMMVGPGGGVATSLASEVEGSPILFANDLDIHSNGSIFFTDTSTRYDRRNHVFILLEGEATGRLLRYDPTTKSTTVVVSGLTFANGVQISKDETFLLVAETTKCRIMRYWLEGQRAAQLELYANLPGFPDNVRINDKGNFWVAIDCCRTRTLEVFSHYPWMRNIYFRLPLKLNILGKMVGMKMYTVIALFDIGGNAIDVLEDRRGEIIRLVSEVREVNGKLWIGTVAHNHVATFSYS
ncbi:Calcium-dependent phosphotriesterase superfamily protein [Rhynchospora pubera]|uniref:Calcium-dependent phosphotriesterase superfamily protein n=1 Tax=Rhynchospora pubera TaxID=906938 RepID=A0AAV8HGG8_9POAL|nr:Calcium-dependent phosphotriesterase superfamily protein [Rhynchospora pubera]KAJ4813828.1 Calcium-dependent phosphotriesterase superfamily protein [Rhynchospora pubera]